MPILDRMAGGGERRLRRAVERIETAFATTSLTGKALDRAVHDYGHGLLLALDLDPRLAARLFRHYDARIPADLYARAINADENLLNDLASREDRDVLTVVFGLATRLGLPPLQRRTRDRLAEMLGREGDAICWSRTWDAGRSSDCSSSTR
jgi:molecular chaperone DnaK